MPKPITENGIVERLRLMDPFSLPEILVEAADEIERLQRELDKAHRLLSQSIGWQRDAELVKAKQEQEIERLRELKTPASRQLVNITKAALDHAEKECEQLRSALVWCSGSDDFAPEGRAREGWEKICQPLIQGGCHGTK